jgi:hypothetical protein
MPQWKIGNERQHPCLDRQPMLGRKLESQDGRVEVLVADRAEKAQEM